MIKLIDFENGPDRIIQMALRDIDMEDLGDAMQGWNEDERNIVLRNMSKRAANLLMGEVQQNAGRVPQHRSNRAAGFFLQKLQHHLRYVAREDADAKKMLEQALEHEPEARPGLPKVDISDDEAFIATFIELTEYARKHGILALSGVEDTVDHPILKKALQYIIDGWDPELYQSIIERMCTEYIIRTRRQLDMITTAVESLAAGDHPAGMEERLRAFLA